jgi:hypothetical protein
VCTGNLLWDGADKPYDLEMRRPGPYEASTSGLPQVEVARRAAARAVHAIRSGRSSSHRLHNKAALQHLVLHSIRANQPLMEHCPIFVMNQFPCPGLREHNASPEAGDNSFQLLLKTVTNAVTKISKRSFLTPLLHLTPNAAVCFSVYNTMWPAHICRRAAPPTPSSCAQCTLSCDASMVSLPCSRSKNTARVWSFVWRLCSPVLGGSAHCAASSCL